MSTPETVYLTDRDLAARYRVSRNTIWTWTKNGQLPRPIKLGPACTRWLKTEVEDLERQRINRGGAR